MEVALVKLLLFHKHAVDLLCMDGWNEQAAFTLTGSSHGSILDPSLGRTYASSTHCEDKAPLFQCSSDISRTSRAVRSESGRVSHVITIPALYRKELLRMATQAEIFHECHQHVAIQTQIRPITNLNLACSPVQNQ